MGLENSGRWPKFLGSATNMENNREAPGSWLQMGIVSAIWGMNQHIEDLSLCVFSFVNLPFKQKIILKVEI